jgi:hypothetical protein
MFRKCQTKDEIRELYKRIVFLFKQEPQGGSDLISLLNKCAKESAERTDYREKLRQKHKEDYSQTKYCKENGKYQDAIEDVDDSDERLNIIYNIHQFANKNPGYKIEFVVSLENYLEDKGKISAAQYNALVKSYYAMKMYENDPDFE